MRFYALPILCGLLGFGLFWLAIGVGSFPDDLAILLFPGSLTAYIFIHGSEGALGDVGLVAGALVQFAVYAAVGTVLTASAGGAAAADRPSPRWIAD